MLEDEDLLMDEEDIDYNILCNDVLENFPFIEDDVDSITDYELFSKGFGYLDDKKANKDDIPSLDNYYNKDEVDDLLDKKANISDIPDVSDFITKDVDDLTNYYDKDTTDDLLDNKANISDIPDVSDFITKDVDDLTNYYDKDTTDDLLDNKANISDIPDLTDYVKNTDYASSSVAGVIKGNVNGFNVSSSGSPNVSTYTYSQYQSLEDYEFIGKGTLENVLTNYIKTSDLIKELNLTNYYINSWSTNGQNYIWKVGNIKFISIASRYGTADGIFNNIPSEYRPTDSTILPATNGSSGGYILLSTNGTISVSSNLVNSNCIATGMYI